jgi:hypothetical protein
MALAQEKEIEKIQKFIKKKRVNAAYVMAGQNIMNFNNLNNFLFQRDYPAVSETHLALGIGGHVIHNKYVVGIEIQRFFEKKRTTEKEFNTSISGNYSLLNMGYLLYSKKGLMIYPFFGLGLGELKLRVIENNIHSFEDINSYQRGSTSKTSSFLINLGFALDYFFKFKEKKRGKNKLVVGMRLGYIHSASKSGWRVNHIHVDDDPVTGLDGPYVRLVIGLGGWVEKLIKIAI